MPISMQTYQLIGLLLLAGIVLKLWLRLRRTELKLAAVTANLIELVNESETGLNQVRALLEQKGKLSPTSVDAAPERPTTAATTAAEAEAEAEMSFGTHLAVNEPWDIDRRHRVLKMARVGLTTEDIARRLSLPDGEVELMLALARQAS